MVFKPRPIGVSELDLCIDSVRLDGNVLNVSFNRKVNLSEFYQKYLLKFKRPGESGRVESFWAEPLNGLKIEVVGSDLSEPIQLAGMSKGLKIVAQHCIVHLENDIVRAGDLAYFYQLYNDNNYGSEFKL